jgi:intracellular protease, PfpI family
MGHALNGKKVAILSTNGFEQSELQEPKRLLESWGAQCTVVAPGQEDSIRGWKGGDWGESVKVDQQLDGANASDYDALVLPGGVINPDKLRMEEKAVSFVRAFADAGKPVAAICHGPWMLIDSGLAADRKLTSWPSLRADLTNAGGKWTDEQVVVDGQVITSRKPDDIPAFTDAVARALAG